MSQEPQLHSSIIALVSLASGIASKHPAMGLCQLEKLRALNVPESQINAVIEIARHIRDEAAEKIDSAFDDAAGITQNDGCCTEPAPAESCCSPSPSGQSCC